MLVAAALVLSYAAGSAGSQAVVPQESAFATTCETARAVGQLAGVNVSNCRLVSVAEEGQVALVTVKVRVAGTGWFTVTESLYKTAWSMTALNIKPL